MLMLKIALNYLLAERKKTLITFLVVSFGISILVFLVGFLYGTDKHTLESISGFETYFYTVIVVAIVDSLMIPGLAIYNNLTSTINKKLKEITILKTTGFTARDIHYIFLSHGLLIGAAGTFTGLLFGSILIVIPSKISFPTTEIFGNDFTVYFSVLQYAVAFMAGIATTMIAAFRPMKKASGLNPINILNS